MAHGRFFMLRSRKTIDAAGTRARLDDVVVTLRREADAAEADPFDEAMIAAVLGLAEAMQTEADALAELEVRLARITRRMSRRRSCPAHLHRVIGRPS